MHDYHRTLVDRYCHKGLIIDTNLLILLLVGSCDPRLVTTFKRTNKYVEDDFRLMSRFVACFRDIVTTPNIITEVCNLCLGLNRRTDNKLYRAFGELIERVRENHIPAVRLKHCGAFFRFGISDTAIVELCGQGRLLLTDDLPLYAYVKKQEFDAVNFNHIRTAAW